MGNTYYQDELRYLREVGPELGEGLDRGQVVGLVERRQRRERGERLQRLAVHAHGRQVPRAAVDDAMAGRDHLGARGASLDPVEELRERLLVPDGTVTSSRARSAPAASVATKRGRAPMPSSSPRQARRRDSPAPTSNTENLIEEEPALRTSRTRLTASAPAARRGAQRRTTPCA